MNVFPTAPASSAEGREEFATTKAESMIGLILPRAVAAVVGFAVAVSFAGIASAGSPPPQPFDHHTTAVAQEASR